MKLMIALSGVVLMLGTGAAALRAQRPPDSAPAFEVAAVKLSNPNPTSPFGSIPMVLPPVGGRFSASNVPLRILVRLAYGVQDFQIIGGPPWQMSNKFDITAKAEDGFAGGMNEVLPMIRTLLADRFHLKVHNETREMPVYALVVARSDGKLGPDIKPSTSDCSNAQAEAQKRLDAFARGGPAALASMLPRPGETIPCSMMPAPSAGGFGLRADGQPLSMLTQLLTQATGRIVRDNTGLTGLFDWQLKFDPEVLMRLASQAGVNLPAAATPPPSDSPSLLTALQEQLGLKLSSERAGVEVLVIDSAELPSPD